MTPAPTVEEFKNMLGWRIALGTYAMEIFQNMPDEVIEAFSRAWYRVYNLNSVEEMEGVGFAFQPAEDGITQVLNVKGPERDSVDCLICGVLSALELQYEARVEKGGQA